MRKAIDTFLSSSPIARAAKLNARVVFRRAATTPAELHDGFVAGAAPIRGEAVCELIAGEQVIATGEVIEKDGHYYFKAREGAS